MNKTIMNPVTIFRTNNVNGATMSIISGFTLKTYMYLKRNLTYCIGLQLIFTKKKKTQTYSSQHCICTQCYF